MTKESSDAFVLCIPVGDRVIQLEGFSDPDDIATFILTEWADWYCEWLQNHYQHFEPIEDDQLWVEYRDGTPAAIVYYDPETLELMIN